MTKSIDATSEMLLVSKHAFRQAEDRPSKAQQRRYERRKIKEYLKLQNWQ